MPDIDLRNIDLLDTHLDFLETDVPSKYFVCLHSVFKTSSRRLSVTIFRLPRLLGRRKIVTLKAC